MKRWMAGLGALILLGTAGITAVGCSVNIKINDDASKVQQSFKDKWTKNTSTLIKSIILSNKQAWSLNDVLKERSETIKSDAQNPVGIWLPKSDSKTFCNNLWKGNKPPKDWPFTCSPTPGPNWTKYQNLTNTKSYLNTASLATNSLNLISPAILASIVSKVNTEGKVVISDDIAKPLIAFHENALKKYEWANYFQWTKTAANFFDPNSNNDVQLSLKQIDAIFNGGDNEEIIANRLSAQAIYALEQLGASKEPPAFPTSFASNDPAYQAFMNFWNRNESDIIFNVIGLIVKGPKQIEPQLVNLILPIILDIFKEGILNHLNDLKTPLKTNELQAGLQTLAPILTSTKTLKNWLIVNAQSETSYFNTSKFWINLFGTSTGTWIGIIASSLLDNFEAIIDPILDKIQPIFIALGNDKDLSNKLQTILSKFGADANIDALTHIKNDITTISKNLTDKKALMKALFGTLSSQTSAAKPSAIIDLGVNLLQLLSNLSLDSNTFLLVTNFSYLKFIIDALPENNPIKVTIQTLITYFQKNELTENQVTAILTELSATLSTINQPPDGQKNPLAILFNPDEAHLTNDDVDRIFDGLGCYLDNQALVDQEFRKHSILNHIYQWSIAVAPVPGEEPTTDWLISNLISDLISNTVIPALSETIQKNIDQIYTNFFTAKHWQITNVIYTNGSEAQPQLKYTITYIDDKQGQFTYTVTWEDQTKSPWSEYESGLRKFQLIKFVAGEN